MMVDFCRIFAILIRMVVAVAVFAWFFSLFDE